MDSRMSLCSGMLKMLKPAFPYPARGHFYWGGMIMIRPNPPFSFLVTGPALLFSYRFLEKRRAAAKSSDALSRLEHLYRLLKMGAITEEEFRTMKEKLKEQL